MGTPCDRRGTAKSVSSVSGWSFSPIKSYLATVDLQVNRAQRLISSQPILPVQHEGVIAINFQWQPENYHLTLARASVLPAEDEHAEACRAIALGLGLAAKDLDRGAMP